VGYDFPVSSYHDLDDGEQQQVNLVEVEIKRNLMEYQRLEVGRYKYQE
jgi:hypothetical protein